MRRRASTTRAACLAALALACPGPPAAAQDEGRPRAPELVEQARLFVPAYEGDHKPFLSPEEERDVRVATALCDAAVALDPGSAYARWWKGQCEVLLGEDARNRGRAEEGHAHYEEALAAFGRALDLDPGYYWARYSRAMALQRLDRPWEAIADFDAAVRAAEEAAAAGDEGAPFVRFKARQWRADARMAVLEFELARDEFRSFYADNGNNRWDLGYSLAETYLRERDFAGARRTWEDLLAVEDFRPYASTYEQLGYLAGLLGDGGRAVERLDECFRHEFEPGMYPRLWFWILAEGERRDAMRGELREYLANPPASLSAWDRRLGLFVLGEGDGPGFLAAADDELARRADAGEPADDLACEALFYAGLRLELDAAAGDADSYAGALVQALERYREALAYRPRTSKWEWSYARLFLARCARELGLGADPGFVLSADGRLEIREPSPLLEAGGRGGGRVERVLASPPGVERPLRGPAAVAAAPRVPGELVQCVLVDDEGARVVATLVVDAGSRR